MLRDEEYYKDIIDNLKEREKEMKCLYKVQSIIDDDLHIDEFLMQIVKHIWGGWQYPVFIRVKITYEGRVYKESGWTETEWVQSADIVIDDKVYGKIEVFYIQPKNPRASNQFLPEEQKLLNTIARKISSYIFNKKLLKTLEMLEEEKQSQDTEEDNTFGLLPLESDVHWVWRYEVAQKIADKLDMQKYGVEAFYLIGSSKNATAGPASDIDILLHFRGDEGQEKLLRAWFEGWSHGLEELNIYKTGYRTGGLIDLHIVTDEDIEKKTSFASMIGAVSDGAKLIRRRSND